MKYISIAAALFVSLLATTSHAQDKQVFVKRVQGWDPDLTWNLSAVPGFQEVGVVVTERSHLFINGHIDVRHLGTAGTGCVNSPNNSGLTPQDPAYRDCIARSVGAGFEVRINGNNLPGSQTGRDITHHQVNPYYPAQITGYAILEPGCHTIEVFGRAYSEFATGSTPTTGPDGLAEVKGGYNQVTYVIENASNDMVRVDGSTVLSQGNMQSFPDIHFSGPSCPT